jgi:ATP-dependent Clp protease adaptor protein ClpS
MQLTVGNDLFASLVAIFTSSFVALALVGHIVKRGRRKAIADEIKSIALTAVWEAARRRHATVTAEHVAGTLLFVPEVVQAVSVAGSSCADLRSAIAAELEKLPVVDDPQNVPVAGDSFTEVFALAEQLGIDHPREVPRRVVAGLLGVGGRAVAEIFERHGVRAHMVPDSGIAVGPKPEPSGQANSYRLPPEAPVFASVVFWNDSKTSMEVVSDILRDIFAMSETEAMYVTMKVHHGGSAAARVAERGEANSLAARAEKAARAQGMPLRVTVEPCEEQGRGGGGGWSGRARTLLEHVVRGTGT